jgi:murein DD-endopeptidase
VITRRGAMTGVALAGLFAAAAPARAQATLPPPLELRVPKAPTVAHGVNGGFLAYELHVTNMGAQPVTLRSVDVITGDAAGRPLLTLSDSLLAQAMARPGVQVPAAERARLMGGLRGVVYVWVPLDGTAVPVTIRNRVRVEQGSGDSVRTQVLDGPVVAVTRTSVRISPPLRGGPWLAANGPGARSGHRRALVTTGGAATIAQRFAIDWVMLNDSNTTFVGDRLKNESYGAEGVDALAVADGRVTEVKDSIPENVPGANSRAVPITLETVGGNHVIIDIGGGYYAFYAHLKPGSLRVKLGDRVRRGQVIGLVGNTGNSTEPHLHFHISDASSPLGSEGVPYAYEAFTLVGRCGSFGGGCERTTPQLRRNEIPLENSIVRFP